MKKNIFSFLTLALTFPLLSGQVGINTSNPKTTFHIDGGKDNPLTGDPSAIQQDNDFVVTSSGKVGIGTTTPSQKLEIQTGGTPASPIPGFKLVDGNQSDNFAIISDAAGVGTWKPITLGYQLINPLGVGKYILPANTQTANYTGVQISLPPGKWIIDLIIPIKTLPDSSYRAGSQFPRLRLMDTNTGPVDVNTGASSFSADAIKPRLVSAAISNSQDLGFMVGSLGINNTSTVTKTYYLYADNYFSVGDTNGDGNVAGEWYRKQTEFVFDNWSEASISYTRIK